jgi:hypothetical protein
MVRETKSEKWERYLAETLARRRNLTLEESVAIVKRDAVRAAQYFDKQRGQKQKQRMAKLKPKQKFKVQYKPHGPPLQGGAPGLGKRK